MTGSITFRANAGVQNLPSLLTLVNTYFKEPMVLQPLSDSFLRQLEASKHGIQWHELFFKPGSRSRSSQSTESFLQAKQQLFGSPANFGFVFVGSLDVDELERELQRLAYGLPAHTAPAEYKKLTTTLMANHDKSSADLSLFLVCSAFENNIDRYSYWELLADIITSRLRLAVREQRGMAYDIVNESIASEDFLHQIRLSVAPDDVENVKALLDQVLGHLASHKISVVELQHAIKRRGRSQEFQPGDYQSASAVNAKQWLATGEVGLTPFNSVDVTEINKLAQCIGDQAKYVVIDATDSFIADSTNKPDSGLKSKSSLRKSVEGY